MADGVEENVRNKKKRLKKGCYQSKTGNFFFFLVSTFKFFLVNILLLISHGAPIKPGIFRNNRCTMTVRNLDSDLS